MSSLIALTGATGFIGQFLLAELPRRGYRIRVLLRRPSDMQVQGSSAVIGDLSRPQNMGAALRDVDAVVHSAGLSGEMTGIPEDDYRSLNTHATVNLANAARKAAHQIRHEFRAKRGGGKVCSEADLPHGDAEDGEAILASVIGAEPTPELAAQVGEECRRLLDKLGDADLRAIAVWQMEGYTVAEMADRLHR